MGFSWSGSGDLDTGFVGIAPIDYNREGNERWGSWCAWMRFSVLCGSLNGYFFGDGCGLGSGSFYLVCVGCSFFGVGWCCIVLWLILCLNV